MLHRWLILEFQNKIQLLSINFNGKRNTLLDQKTTGLQTSVVLRQWPYGLHDPSNIPAFLFQVCINNYISQKNSRELEKGFPSNKRF